MIVLCPGCREPTPFLDLLELIDERHSPTSRTHRCPACFERGMDNGDWDETGRVTMARIFWEGPPLDELAALAFDGYETDAPW